MPTTDPFASMLAALRATGLTTSDIVEQAGISRTSIWRYQNGEGRRPLFETYAKLDGLCRRKGIDPARGDPRTR